MRRFGDGDCRRRRSLSLGHSYRLRDVIFICSQFAIIAWSPRFMLFDQGRQHRLGHIERLLFCFDDNA